MINNTIFFTMNNPPAIIRYRDCSGYKAEIIQEFKASSETPIDMVMDYMLKRINEIDDTRKNLRKQYPNLLPADL